MPPPPPNNQPYPDRLLRQGRRCPLADSPGGDDDGGGRGGVWWEVAGGEEEEVDDGDPWPDRGHDSSQPRPSGFRSDP